MNRAVVGMIGGGSRLRGLWQHAIRRHPEAGLSLKWVADPRQEAVAALREVAVAKLRQASALDDILEDDEVSWVWIGSWNCHHREHAVAALRAGKNVFLEKPLATTLEDCLEIRKVAAESPGAVFFGFCLRYSPHYRRVKAIVEAGEIGRVVSFEFNETLFFSHGGAIMGNWRRESRHAGSHVLEKCCHDMDIANWLVGARAARVASFGGRNFFLPENARLAKAIGKAPNGAPAYRDWTELCTMDPFDGGGDIVDNQVAILEYANGVRATFHTNLNSSLNERRTYILGTEGTLRADAVAGRIEVARINYEGLRREEFTGEVQGHNLADMGLVDELVPAMTAGTLPPTGIREGLEAAATCFGIDEALASGRVVSMDAIWSRVDSDMTGA